MPSELPSSSGISRPSDSTGNDSLPKRTRFAPDLEPTDACGPSGTSEGVKRGMGDDDDPTTKRQRPDGSDADCLHTDVVDVMFMASRLVYGSDELPTGCVCELYSPPRVDPIAQAKGFEKGISMDLLTDSSNGGPWDFSKAADRQRAYEWVRRNRPILVIGSPMCGMFSALMNLNREKMGEARFRKLYKEAIEHLRFAISIYQ